MKLLTVHGVGTLTPEYRFDGTIRIADALHALSAGLAMPCGGHGRCGGCKARITGDVFLPGDQEKQFLSESELLGGIRLCCYAEAFGDCEVFLPDSGAMSVQIQGRMPNYLLNPLFEGNYGIAADIGTTTVIVALFSLKDGKMLKVRHAKNAQSAFGADVISRIGYANEHGVTQVKEAITRQLDTLINELCSDAKIELKEISGAVITGNTTMLHFLTGLDPEGIAHAPFTPRSLFGGFMGASEIGLFLQCRVFLPRAVSAYIGADIVCGALACSLPSGKKTLFIDIGTNGEMLLTISGKILSCSTAAGPAFEGAGISCGMIALPGAIDRIQTDGAVFKISTIGGKEPVGICGSGLIDALAFMFKSGIIDDSGRIQLTGHPFEHLVSEGERGRLFKLYGEKIVLTQQDVRQLQLTKAAIAAGIDTLLFESKMKIQDIDETIIAGGFGSFINFQNAEAIGLFPEGLLGRMTSAGNTALSGASLMLLSKETVNQSKRIFEHTQELLLSQNSFFKERYIERMMF